MRRLKNKSQSIDSVFDRAFRDALDSNAFFPMTYDCYSLGKCVVKKEQNEYDIYYENKKIYSSISLIESAILVAFYYQRKDYEGVRFVTFLQDKYNKYFNDNIAYLNSIKTCEKNKDTDKLVILQSRFSNSVNEMKYYRNEIKVLSNQLVRLR